jgi:hypothetical protein
VYTASRAQTPRPHPTLPSSIALASGVSPSLLSHGAAQLQRRLPCAACQTHARWRRGHVAPSPVHTLWLPRTGRGDTGASLSPAAEPLGYAAGKRYGSSGAKIGNAYLTWALSEAAVLFLRAHPAGQKYLGRLEKKHGKGKAWTVLVHKLARAVYDMLKRGVVFDLDTFLRS